MKQNSIFINLLGDFYQNNSGGDIISGIDSIYTEMLFRKYENIITKYISTEKMSGINIVIGFIDRDSFQYGDTFEVVDIKKNPIYGITGTIDKDLKYKQLSLDSSNKYIFNGIDKEKIINSNDRYILTNFAINKGIEEYKMFDIVDIDIDSDVINFINTSLIHGKSDIDAATNIINIILGSPYIIEEEETVVYADEDVVSTDKHLYDVSRYNGSVHAIEGDILKNGYALMRLCSIMEPDIRDQSMYEISRAVSTYGSASSYVSLLTSAIASNVSIAEIRWDVFSDDTNSGVKKVIGVAKNIGERRIVAAISPIIDVSSVSATELSRNNISSGHIANVDSIYMVSTEKTDIELCNAEEQVVFIIDSVPTVNINEDSSMQASDKSESAYILAEEDGKNIIQDTYLYEPVDNDDWVGSMNEYIIGGVKDSPAIVSIINDTCSILSDTESSKFLVSKHIISHVTNNEIKIVNAIDHAISISSESPIFRSINNISIGALEDISYNSKTVVEANVEAVEESSNMIIGDSALTAIESSEKTISSKSLLSVDDNIDAHGTSAELSIVGISENEFVPISSYEDSITVIDLVIVDSENQIDF